MFAPTRAFVFRGLIMGDNTGEELLRYLTGHVPTGSFLEAVISNDLRESCARADDDNMWQLPIIVAYLYNEAPTGSWGSRENYIRWLQMRADPAAIASESQRDGKHICQASYDGDGKLLDECARCGHNFRDTSVHETWANSAAEEPKS